MPRQIIDTESSRPAYIRRNVTIGVVIIVIVAIVAYLFVTHGQLPHHLGFQESPWPGLN